jgi:hypothetical protein
MEIKFCMYILSWHLLVQIFKKKYYIVFSLHEKDKCPLEWLDLYCLHI